MELSKTNKTKKIKTRTQYTCTTAAFLDGCRDGWYDAQQGIFKTAYFSTLTEYRKGYAAAYA
ncbi:MAG: hypothetical protein GWN00_07220, partial [Aliifodinibius sp.]|nr:hypothetical protein [Fodinibius sp.]NIV11019.1 hypothetical protein [Fodinibius sp.]NIY24606.1 hypothetical protein [Fodinibius sp.]